MHLATSCVSVNSKMTPFKFDSSLEKYLELSFVFVTVYYTTWGLYQE